jgi:hypothetical protein
MSRRHDVQIRRVLYGTRDGRWALLYMPGDATLPTRLAGMRYLGDPVDVLRQAYEQQMVRGAVQEAIGKLLGVGQQQVSNYLTGRCVPELDAAGWSALTRIRHQPDMVSRLAAMLRAVRSELRAGETADTAGELVHDPG